MKSVVTLMEYDLLMLYAMPIFGNSAWVNKGIFSKWPVDKRAIQSARWPVHFNVKVHKRFTDKISDCTLQLAFKNCHLLPGWLAGLVRASPCVPKSWGFKSWSRLLPRFQVQFLSGAPTRGDLSLFPCPSEINKHTVMWGWNKQKKTTWWVLVQ